MLFARYASIFFILIMVTSCTIFRKNELKSEYLLPSETDIPGWIKTSEPVSIKGSTAAGEASDYYGPGLKHLISSRYTSIEDDTVYIDLFILRFSSPLDAYGFFSSRLKFREWISGDNTDEYKDDTVFILRKGNFVILAENRTLSPFLRGEMAQLIKTAETNLGNNYSSVLLPEWISLLKNFTGNSPQFSRKELEYFKGIDNLFYSRISTGSGDSYIFISERNSFDQAFRLYRTLVESEKYITVEAFNRHGAFLKIKEKNYRFISINGNIISGIWECSDISEGESQLKKLNDLIEKRGSRK